MATLASKYDAQTIENYTIRWQEDLTGAQRAAIASEVERKRSVPEYSWVNRGNLYVDESYQRPLSTERVWEIATHFEWRLYNALYVGERGGKLYVIDGRHRLAAANILNLFAEVPCEIRRTAGVEEEAMTFVDLQERRRKITSAQRFAAKLVARDPHAIALNKVITQYGFKVVSEQFSPNSYTKVDQNEITAVGTLEQIYRAGGRDRVAGVLSIIRDAWDGVPPTTSAWVLRAVNRILEKQPGTSAATFARRLKTSEPWRLIERGWSFSHSNEIPASEAIAEVLLKVAQ